MMNSIINLLTATVKVFAVASMLQLPLDNIRNLFFSSEPMMILLLFCFVVGETKSVIPAFLMTVVYLYAEVMPRKLRIKDTYFKDYEKA